MSSGCSFLVVSVGPQRPPGPTVRRAPVSAQRGGVTPEWRVLLIGADGSAGALPHEGGGLTAALSHVGAPGPRAPVRGARAVPESTRRTSRPGPCRDARRHHRVLGLVPAIPAPIATGTHAWHSPARPGTHGAAGSPCCWCSDGRRGPAGSCRAVAA
jgi:hypothetical protein